MKQWRSVATGGLCCALLFTLAAGCNGTLKRGKADPTAISVWHYYNGAQQQIFEALVDEFNETIGVKENIVVEPHGYGKINDLTKAVMSSIQHEVGAAEVPDIFAAYADTAYEINCIGQAADLSQYLTEEEQGRYVSSYLEEGRFDGGYKIFPIAKSTELLFLNQTEWEAFATATSADEGKLATWEGLATIAEEYYRWSDGLTPEIPEDGRAFFGRDAFANYIIIGSYQLGTELFRVEEGQVEIQIDRDILHKLWENYYVPYINGYFSAYGKFRSDDLRTGDLAAFVGATSGATYFPTQVTKEDGSTTEIEGAVYPLPNFEGTRPVAVQQGAGMVVSKSTEEREHAAVEFLKWFTEPKQNVRFATASGYLPVTSEANDRNVLAEEEQSGGEELPEVLRQSLNIGVDTVRNYDLYTSRPFEHGFETRKVVENSMQEKAKADREAVLARMAEGVSREAAVAEFNTDENFDTWLQDFSNRLEAAEVGH